MNLRLIKAIITKEIKKMGCNKRFSKNKQLIFIKSKASFSNPQIITNFMKRIKEKDYNSNNNVNNSISTKVIFTIKDRILMNLKDRNKKRYKNNNNNNNNKNNNNKMRMMELRTYR